MVTNLEQSNFDTEIPGQSGFSRLFGGFFIVFAKDKALLI